MTSELSSIPLVNFSGYCHILEPEIGETWLVITIIQCCMMVMLMPIKYNMLRGAPHMSHAWFEFNFSDSLSSDACGWIYTWFLQWTMKAMTRTKRREFQTHLRISSTVDMAGTPYGRTTPAMSVEGQLTERQFQKTIWKTKSKNNVSHNSNQTLRKPE